jgi:hypothetical protein
MTDEAGGGGYGGDRGLPGGGEEVRGVVADAGGVPGAGQRGGAAGGVYQKAAWAIEELPVFRPGHGSRTWG